MMKMNITFFMGNEVSNRSYNNFFEDSIILWEYNENRFFCVEGGIGIRIFYIKTNDNTIKTIDGFAKTIDRKNNRYFSTIAKH